MEKLWQKAMADLELIGVEEQIEGLGGKEGSEAKVVKLAARRNELTKTR